MGRDVVDDDVVIHVVGEVPGHQEAQAAAVVVAQVGLDQVGVDTSTGPAPVDGVAGFGRQLAGDHDAAAFVVGTVEVDAVVVDPARPGLRP